MYEASDKMVKALFLWFQFIILKDPYISVWESHRCISLYMYAHNIIH